MLNFTVNTSFDPQFHGFRFANSFSFHPGFFGRPDLNNWNMGLCGGMAATALDIFRKGRPSVLLAHPPGMTCPEGELLWELFSRQVISLFPPVLGKMLEWAQIEEMAEYDKVIPVPTGGFGGLEFKEYKQKMHGLATLVRRDEWPKLKVQLDGDLPAVLCLIRQKGILSDPTENHQVLATGYRVEASNKVTLFLYDPNKPWPKSDVGLEFLINGNLMQATQIYGDGSANRHCRGFFVIDTQPDPLSAPILMAPRGDIRAQPGALDFRWQPTEFAGSHVLQVRTAAGVQTFGGLAGSASTARPHFSAPGQDPICAWRVYAADRDGNRGFATPWTEFRLRGYTEHSSGGGGTPTG